MKIAIVGSRGFDNYELLCNMVDMLIERKKLSDVEIVSGGARGADELAERYAKERQMPIKIFHAQWLKHPKSAGFIRNSDIWKEADMGIAFWDGKSPGTKHSFGLSKKMNKKLVAYDYKKNKILKENER